MRGSTRWDGREMPRPLKWEEIRGLLSPDKRKEIEARVGRPPPRSRRARAKPEPSEPPVPVTGGHWSVWSFRTCPRCLTEFLAPPDVMCPIGCGDWIEEGNEDA